MALKKRALVAELKTFNQDLDETLKKKTKELLERGNELQELVYIKNLTVSLLESLKPRRKTK
jgi:hypothetical protein